MPHPAPEDPLAPFYDSSRPTVELPGTRISFPEDFRFGTACADHQVEHHDPEREDVWDLWEVCQDLVLRERGTDFWNRYEEDIVRAKGLGCRMFRFSIAWARVEPRPGEFDPEAILHYRRLAETIREQGMQVMVTLLHFVWPVHVEQRGGLTALEFPDWFQRYAERMAEALGDTVDYWITFNEPSQLVYGFTKPWWQDHYYMPPGLPSSAGPHRQAEEVGKLIRNLFTAHARARTEIRDRHPLARVGVNPLITGLPPWLQRFMDWQAVRCYNTDVLASSTGRVSSPLLSERGRVDVVLGGLTLEEDAGVSFSDPYLFTGKALLCGPVCSAQSVRDLSGFPVGVIGGTNAEEALLEIIPGVRPVRFTDYSQAMESLETGVITALFGDDVFLKELQLHSCEKCRLLARDLTIESWAAAVPIGHVELLELVNRGIARFKREHWQEAVERDMNFQVEPPPDRMCLQEFIASRVSGGGPERMAIPANPGPELRAIFKRGWIRIGVRDDTPGFASKDAEGHLHGLEIALARTIAEEVFGCPDKVVFEIMPARQRKNAVRSPRHWLNRAWRFYGMAAMVTNANWWYLGMAGRLNEFLCPKEAIGAMDFVGMDYYWGLPGHRLHRFKRLGDAAAGRFRQAPVWPRGLYNSLRMLGSWFPDQEILVVENGSVPEADRVSRDEYLRAHIRQVGRAIRSGVNVTAYLCWSITSNREWGHPFSEHTDFGLYHVDIDHDPNLLRIETQAARAYRRLIKRYMG